MLDLKLCRHFTALLQGHYGKITLARRLGNETALLEHGLCTVKLLRLGASCTALEGSKAQAALVGMV